MEKAIPSSDSLASRAALSGEGAQGREGVGASSPGGGRWRRMASAFSMPSLDGSADGSPFARRPTYRLHFSDQLRSENSATREHGPRMSIHPFGSVPAAASVRWAACPPCSSSSSNPLPPLRARLETGPWAHLLGHRNLSILGCGSGRSWTCGSGANWAGKDVGINQQGVFPRTVLLSVSGRASSSPDPFSPSFCPRSSHAPEV